MNKLISPLKKLPKPEDIYYFDWPDFSDNNAYSFIALRSRPVLIKLKDDKDCKNHNYDRDGDFVHNNFTVGFYEFYVRNDRETEDGFSSEDGETSFDIEDIVGWIYLDDITCGLEVEEDGDN